MDWTTTIALINYFVREKYYGTALLKINEYLKQQNIKKNDQLLLIKCYCLTKLGIINYFFIITKK